MYLLVFPIYEFVVSTKSDFLLEHEVENHIKPNYIVTLTEIKKPQEGRGPKEGWKSGRLTEVKNKKKLLR